MRFSAWGDRLLGRFLLAGLPGTALALALLWLGNVFGPGVRWLLTTAVLTAWAALALAARNHLVFRLRTLSNVAAAIRQGDYTVRARSGSHGEGLEDLARELNALADTLHRSRLDALEAAALLRKVLDQIEAAVFAFDDQSRLLLVNPAGERLLGRPAARILGRTAAELDLDRCLDEPGLQTADLFLAGAVGRWGVSRRTFREQGMPHRLLVLTDLSRALREEERRAWQRLIRVMGHELNNSLAPITSLAGSLESLIAREELPADWREDLAGGLRVISSRAAALARFSAAYSQLARLPEPSCRAVDLAAVSRRVAGLESRLEVALPDAEPLLVRADPDQVEQLLINLVRNAADAALETGGRVEIAWAERHGFAEITVQDEGPGLSGTANLFVPFFTTKPGGSGIGLVLSRQIAEAHGGGLTLENRDDARGCRARVRLPLDPGG